MCRKSPSTITHTEIIMIKINDMNNEVYINVDFMLMYTSVLF